jgi:hypothetical protein
MQTLAFRRRVAPGCEHKYCVITAVLLTVGRGQRGGCGIDLAERAGLADFSRRARS